MKSILLYRRSSEQATFYTNVIYEKSCYFPSFMNGHHLLSHSCSSGLLRHCLRETPLTLWLPFVVTICWITEEVLDLNKKKDFELAILLTGIAQLNPMRGGRGKEENNTMHLK